MTQMTVHAKKWYVYRTKWGEWAAIYDAQSSPVHPIYRRYFPTWEAAITFVDRYVQYV